MVEQDLTADFRGRIYVGRSKKSDDPDFSLDKALDDAYKKATQDHKTPPFRVLEIWIDGDNPLSEYRVAVGAGG
jgi:hypothetical protein